MITPKNENLIRIVILTVIFQLLYFIANLWFLKKNNYIGNYSLLAPYVTNLVVGFSTSYFIYTNRIRLYFLFICIFWFLFIFFESNKNPFVYDYKEELLFIFHAIIIKNINYLFEYDSISFKAFSLLSIIVFNFINIGLIKFAINYIDTNKK